MIELILLIIFTAGLIVYLFTKDTPQKWEDESEMFITEEYRKKYPNENCEFTGSGVRALTTREEFERTISEVEDVLEEGKNET